MTWKIRSYSQQPVPDGDWPYQDRPLSGSLLNGGNFIGVLDGHGFSNACVEYCCKKLYQLLPSVTMSREQGHLCAERQLREIFADVAAGAREKGGGACVCVTCLWTDGSVTTATIGDTTFTAYLSVQSDMLYVGPHHNVLTNLVERRRAVEERGGIYENGYILNGGLGVQCSRVLGDREMEGIVVATPDIASFRVGQGGWVAVMSDGVLDPTVGSVRFDHGRITKDMLDQDLSLEEIVARTIKEDDATLLVAQFS